ncbi:hypothetical protein N2152v2_009639 [Parachlorella kessleri]
MVVASIYVNPTQFAAHEDFGVYPRSMEGDLQMLAAAGCVAVFAPKTLYHSPAAGADTAMVVGASGEYDPDAHETWVQLEHLSQGLCANSRPHFFRGVCTPPAPALGVQVVSKLLHIVEPDMAFFGKKDYQQWRIIERMVRDLNFAVEVVGMPIIREADGLAMSSRNALLTPANRHLAPCIYRGLTAAKQAAESGAVTSAEQLQKQVAAAISEHTGKVDYVEVVDAKTLRPVQGLHSGRLVLIAVAAHFGSVRLIDNIEITPGSASSERGQP